MGAFATHYLALYLPWWIRLRLGGLLLALMAAATVQYLTLALRRRVLRCLLLLRLNHMVAATAE